MKDTALDTGSKCCARICISHCQSLCFMFAWLVTRLKSRFTDFGNDWSDEGVMFNPRTNPIYAVRTNCFCTNATLHYVLAAWLVTTMQTHFIIVSCCALTHVLAFGLDRKLEVSSASVFKIKPIVVWILSSRMSLYIDDENTYFWGWPNRYYGWKQSIGGEYSMLVDSKPMFRRVIGR